MYVSLYLSKVQVLSSVVHFSSCNQSLPTAPKVAGKARRLQRWLCGRNAQKQPAVNMKDLQFIDVF